MATQSNVLNWARQLNSKVPFFEGRIRPTACTKLAADKMAQAIPFLLSALANSNEEVRRIAEDGLKSLNTPESYRGAFAGLRFHQWRFRAPNPHGFGT